MTLLFYSPINLNVLINKLLQPSMNLKRSFTPQ